MHRAMIVFSLAVLASQPAAADDWPRWRGPDRSGVSKETGLLKEWAKEGPPLRWQAKKIGTGYSSPVVVKGRVYLQTTKDNQEFAQALDEKTGKQLWITAIGKVGKNQSPPYPGTRSTPTVDGDRLYCLASDGELASLDTVGKMLWQKNLARDRDGRPGPLGLQRVRPGRRRPRQLYAGRREGDPGGTQHICVTRTSCSVTMWPIRRRAARTETVRLSRPARRNSRRPGPESGRLPVLPAQSTSSPGKRKALGRAAVDDATSSLCRGTGWTWAGRRQTTNRPASPRARCWK